MGAIFMHELVLAAAAAAAGKKIEAKGAEFANMQVYSIGLDRRRSHSTLVPIMFSESS